MLEEQLYICFQKDGCDDKELELAERYWTLELHQLKKFKFDAFNLAREYGYTQNKASNLIKKFYPVTGSSKRFCCLSCGNKILLYSRNQYTKLPLSGRMCDACIAEEKLTAKNKKAQFQKLFIESYLTSDYSISSLDYLELIYLYLWLERAAIDENNESIVLLLPKTNILGLEELETKLRYRLVDKGFLLSLDNIEDCIFTEYNFEKNSIQHLDFVCVLEVDSLRIILLSN